MRKPTKKTTTKPSTKKPAPKKSATAPNRKTTAIGPRKTRAVTKLVKKAAAPPKKAAPRISDSSGNAFQDLGRTFAKEKKLKVELATRRRKIAKSPDLAAGYKGGGKPAVDQNEMYNLTPTEPKRRGRPRKQPTPVFETTPTDNSVPAKRGRGRPRKIPVVETVGSDTLTSSLASLPDSVLASPRKTGNTRKSAPRI